MCLKMAGQAEDRMNLAALQQRDPYITDIVDTASHVALYFFSPKENEWESTSIEGTLFVYKRSASPINGFMILNRLGLNNLIEPIIKDLEFQLQDPFLLYRNTKAIYGIWFYDKDECARLGQLMNCLLQLAIEHHNAKSQNSMRQRRASESDSMQDRQGETTAPDDPHQVDIIQMLSKAQHEYVKSKGGSTEPKPIIDNPNAAATKSTQLIRPQPRKLSPSQQLHPEQDSDVKEEKTGDLSGGTTPTTAISLEALFRNASINKQRSAPSGMDSMAIAPSAGRPRQANRSISMSESSHREIETQSQPLSFPPGPLHPLLQKLMSSQTLGSHVESIERQQLAEQHSPRHPPGPGGDVPPPVPVRVSSMLPDGGRSGISIGGSSGISAAGSGISTSIGISGITAPPSSGIPVSGSVGITLEQNLSPTQTMSFNIIKPQEKSPEVLPFTSPDVVPSASLPGGLAAGPDKSSARNLEERIATIYSGASESTPDQSTDAPKALLTPAVFETTSTDMLQAPLAVTLPAPTFSPDVLLAPGVFTTSSRVSPPGSTAPSVTGETSVLQPLSLVAEHSPPMNPQIAPLTKQQLQQALVFLLQTDSDFVSNIHEAYLKSLKAGLSSGKPHPL